MAIDRSTFMAHMRRLALFASLAMLQAAPTVALAEDWGTKGVSVLDYPAPRHGAIETGYLLRRSSVELQFGSHQTAPGTATGTGRQVYEGGVTWRGAGDLQFGIEAQVYDDPPEAPIAGDSSNITLLGLAGDLKWSILATDRLSIAGAASVEAMRFETELFGTASAGNSGDQLIGSLRFPLSYRLTPDVTAHLTPWLAILPDKLNGQDFYGTSANLGLGVTWQPVSRLQAYGGVQMPIGPGGNTLSETGDIERTPVWTVGARYAVTPRTAVDLYASNGLGATPATRHLTSFGDGSAPMFGAMLTFTPGPFAADRKTYRVETDANTPAAAGNPVADGLTLASGDTLAPGTFSIEAFGGTSDSSGAALRFSPDQDLEFEAILERYGDDGSVGPARNPSRDARYMLGGRLRLFDQAYGAPVSLSVRALAGRDISRPTVGVFYAGVPMSRSLSDRTSVTLSPRFASFGETTIAGLGLGVSHRLTDGLRVLGEVTGVEGGDPAVWAAGLQYDLLPEQGIALEIGASNAIGTQGLGSLVAQDEPILRVGFSLGRGGGW